MKRFLLPALAVSVLAGSATAADPSSATSWTCTSQASGSANYVIIGNELKKRDDDLERYKACRRKHPVPTPGPDGDAFLTDPCEPLDLHSYTFQIVSNNPAGLVAVSPEMGERDDGSIAVAGRMIIIEKLTGHFVETFLSTPMLPLRPKVKTQSDAGISVAGYGGTCDAMPIGGLKSMTGVPDHSHHAHALVEEEKRPTKKHAIRKAHVHVHRHDYHHKHVHRHAHHHKHVHRHDLEWTHR